MKIWKLFASVLIAGLFIVLLLGLKGTAQGQTETGVHRLRNSAAQSLLDATAVVSHAFSYQGVLQDDGAPVNGSRQMTFTLYSDAACAAMVGTPVNDAVSVNGGLFSVDLAFDQTHFDGQALWLKTEVEGTTLGCQPIHTVPYANGLRPGAIISGAVGSDANLLHVRSGSENVDEGVVGAQLGLRSSLGYPIGVYGYAYEYGSVGVWGVSDSEFGWAVNGVAQGLDSIGVRGIANALTGTTYGVYGEGASSAGYGGYFANNATADAGWALAAEGRHGAIITSTQGTTLHASGAGDSSIGDDAVRGTHTGDGIVGESTGTGDLDNGIIGFSAGGYGVYGFSNGTGQYGGYFGDPIFVNGGCTGCTMNYVARNTSTNTLLIGDVVRAVGTDAGLAGAQMPVIQIAPSASDAPVLGVILGRTEMTLVEPGPDDVQPGAHYGAVGGAVEPGDYCIIVVQGMAQVRLDPAVEVQAGDFIQAGTNGARPATGAPAIGMVLDKAGHDGLVWVLVGFD